MSALPSLQWEVQQQDKITLCISGELSRSTLLPLHQAFQDERLFSVEICHQFIQLDLIAVSRIDSAGFALLCEIIRYCEQSEAKQIQLLSYPVQIMTLADLFGLSDWISYFLLCKN